MPKLKEKRNGAAAYELCVYCKQ